MSMTLRNASVVNLLASRQVEVSVGEPWDFESQAGQNRLDGVIIAAHPDGEQSVVLEVTPFVCETGETVSRLEATPRYTDDREDFIKKLADGESVPSNLSYGGQIPEAQMPEGHSPFLIGSIRLATVS